VGYFEVEIPSAGKFIRTCFVADVGPNLQTRDPCLMFRLCGPTPERYNERERCVLMKLFSIACASFLLLLLVPRSDAQDLKELTQASIVVEQLEKTAKDIGLSEETLESQTLVGLKRDLPKLKISKDASPYVYVNVLAVEAGPDRVAVYVNIKVNRPVKILRDWSNSEVTGTVATVWNKGRLLAGPKYDMASRIREAISELTTKLAAAYYRDNPE
jgi:hypothetical protein